MAYDKCGHVVALLLATTGILSSGQTLGAPQPVSVTGDLEDGAEITVSGSDFGTKSQAPPLFFDTQDAVWINGAESHPYSDLANGTPVPGGGNWPWRSSGPGNLQIWKDGGYPRYGAVFDGSHPADAWLEKPRGYPDPATREITETYIRWWFKMNSPPDSGGSQSNKFIRIWDSNEANVGVRISWTHHHLVDAGTGNNFSCFASANPISGEWNLMEIYVRTTPSPAVQTWTNGHPVHNVVENNNETCANSGGPVHFSPTPGFQGLMPRLWGLDGSGDANFVGKTIELSDYYADSTRARVEIGDAPQWKDVRIREPQIPIDWNGNSIRLTLHQGMLGSLTGGYLYVIDANGDVNQTGLPLDGVAPPAQMPVPTVQ